MKPEVAEWIMRRKFCGYQVFIGIINDQVRFRGLTSQEAREDDPPGLFGEERIQKLQA